ncbi:hypothetical protein D3C75_1079320 [compost metagenome]
MGQIKSLLYQVDLLGIVLHCEYPAFCTFYYPDGRSDPLKQVDYGNFDWRTRDNSGAGDRCGSVFRQTGRNGITRGGPGGNRSGARDGSIHKTNRLACASA